MSKIDAQSLDKNLSLGEEIANSITHGLGVIFGIVALVFSILKASNTYALMGGIIFCTSIILLYLMSTLYHAFPKATKVKALFERFDHVFIYVLIGGSFAPVLLNIISKPLGIQLFILQWSVIVVAITLKLVKFHSFHKIHILMYLLLGWSALALLFPIYQHSINALILLLLGGLSYTVGVLFYVFRWFKYSHMVWHFFVLGGTLLHFICTYLYFL